MLSTFIQQFTLAIDSTTQAAFLNYDDDVYVYVALIIYQASYVVEFKSNASSPVISDMGCNLCQFLFQSSN